MMEAAAAESHEKRRRLHPPRLVLQFVAGVLLPLVVANVLRKSVRDTTMYSYLFDTRQRPATRDREALRRARSRKEFMLPREVSRTEFVLTTATNQDDAEEEKKTTTATQGDDSNEGSRIKSNNETVVEQKQQALDKLLDSETNYQKPEKKDDDKNVENKDEPLKKNLSREEKAALAERRNLEYAYQNPEEMDQRSKRFPSVEERVKLLMSNWYLPPCKDDNKVQYKHVNNHELVLRELLEEGRLFRVTSNFDGSHEDGVFDYVHFLDRNAMNATCSHRYCKDFMEFLFPAMDRLEHSLSSNGTATETASPIMYQFGDEEKTKAPLHSNPKDRGVYPGFPVLKKIRQSLTSEELQRVTTPSLSKSEACGAPKAPLLASSFNKTDESERNLQPIVFKLKTQRHYSRIYQVAQADISWDEKVGKAAFRGELTGKHSVNDDSPSLSDTEKCRMLPRCWLVYQNSNSDTLVDAKLALPFANLKDIPETLDGRSLYGEKLSLEEMLQYKALIMLEGNDVSSGLKWALFSNSVVLMPTPSFTSWAMEELLKPWVHYIPITVNNNSTGATTSLTGVEEKVQWVLDHDKEAQEIARAGKLWISDLVLHPESAADETAIFDEIVRRYRAHFQSDASIETG